MQSLPIGLSSEHVKILMCLVLAALAYFKLADIQDSKTKIKKSYDIDVGGTHSHPKCVNDHSPSSSPSSSNLLTTKQNPHTCALCQGKQNVIKCTSGSSSTGSNQHAQQEQDEYCFDGIGEGDKQTATLGTYILSKYRRKMQEANLNPLFDNISETGPKLRREYEQQPMDEEPNQRYQIRENQAVVVEPKIEEERYETPKISRQCDPNKFGTDKTDLSFKKPKVSVNKIRGGQLGWGNKHRTSANQESSPQTKKKSTNLFRNNQSTAYKPALQCQFKLNKAIGKEKKR